MRTRMWQIVIMSLILSGCASQTTYQDRRIFRTTTDQSGMVTGYILRDGTITGQTGLVKGYIE